MPPRTPRRTLGDRRELGDRSRHRSENVRITDVTAGAEDQNGSSGSTAIATNKSVRYVMEAWKTRIGRGSVPRTARVYRRCD
jgi:hypothetical protein